MNPYDIFTDYAKKHAESQAYLIDSKLMLVVHPRPNWCPKWLYIKIIKESVELVAIK